MDTNVLRSCLIVAAALLAARGAPAQTGTAPAIRYGFAVDWSRERVSSKGGGSGAVGESTKLNTFVGHVKITNRSSAALQNLEVHIQMHYKAVDGRAQIDEHKDSVKTIPSIRQNETVTVDSDPVVLKVTELDGGYRYTSGAPNRQADSIRGGIVTLHHDGKQVFEYVSNPALKNFAGKAKSSAPARK